MNEHYYLLLYTDTWLQKQIFKLSRQEGYFYSSYIRYSEIMKQKYLLQNKTDGKKLSGKMLNLGYLIQPCT